MIPLFCIKLHVSIFEKKNEKFVDTSFIKYNPSQCRHFSLINGIYLARIKKFLIKHTYTVLAENDLSATGQPIITVCSERYTILTPNNIYNLFIICLYLYLF